jgi:hypothetical protein
MYLGREIVWRAAERPGHVRTVLGKPEVSDLNMTVRVEEDVLRLEVSVDDVKRMEVVQCERDLGCIEFGHRVWEALNDNVKIGSLT